MGSLDLSGVLKGAATLALAALLAVAVQAYAVKPYRIPSPSMEGTLTIGQRVLVDRLSHRLGATPHVGDIIVFHPPVGAAQQKCGAPNEGFGWRIPCSRPIPKESNATFIKRVVAVGGDRVAILAGFVFRNGQRAREPFTSGCEPGLDCDFPEPITVPKGYVFVMGDNRGRSDDSRFWGPIPVSWVIGRAFATYWPPSRVGGF